MGSEWVREAEAAFAAATTVAALEDAKARFLGKNGVITNALKDDCEDFSALNNDLTNTDVPRNTATILLNSVR